jgi:hypothetical protein
VLYNEALKYCIRVSIMHLSMVGGGKFVNTAHTLSSCSNHPFPAYSTSGFSISSGSIQWRRSKGLIDEICDLHSSYYRISSINKYLIINYVIMNNIILLSALASIIESSSIPRAPLFSSGTESHFCRPTAHCLCKKPLKGRCI